MTRTIYVNGKYQPYTGALLHVEDRATLFADSVYEVIEIRDGRLVDKTAHLARLAYSLGEIRMELPVSRAALNNIMRETVRKNRVTNGMLYLQISRGVAKRDFVFPDETTAKPTLILLARHANRDAADEKARDGIHVITSKDIRWQRPYIKTTQLLASVLARQSALEKGAGEAWFVDEDGFVTEGAASNAWIITQAKELITRPADNTILKGITRAGVRRIIDAVDLNFTERKFTLEEALKAKECFISAATNLVMPVVKIDDNPINDGRPGPISSDLRAKFHQFAELSR